jgi:hypothetical protein
MKHTKVTKRKLEEEFALPAANTPAIGGLHDHSKF